MQCALIFLRRSVICLLDRRDVVRGALKFPFSSRTEGLHSLSHSNISFCFFDRNSGSFRNALRMPHKARRMNQIRIRTRFPLQPRQDMKLGDLKGDWITAVEAHDQGFVEAVIHFLLAECGCARNRKWLAPMLLCIAVCGQLRPAFHGCLL